MYEAKKVLAIGVSNFNIEHLQYFVKNAKVKPMMNQVEIHPGFGQKDLVDYCHEHKIAVISWKTLIGGNCENIPLLQKLAKKHNTSTSLISLRWAWQKNLVVIPKSKNKDRIMGNSEINKFVLSESEINEIDNLPQSRYGWVPDASVKWE